MVKVSAFRFILIALATAIVPEFPYAPCPPRLGEPNFSPLKLGVGGLKLSVFVQIFLTLIGSGKQCLTLKGYFLDSDFISRSNFI